MALKLTWDDLILRGAELADAPTWFAHWRSMVHGPVRPRYMSKFGSWFLERKGGSVELLNVLDGTMESAADSVADLEDRMNEQTWQEEHLLSELIYVLHLRGLVAGPGQVYGFAPHPSISGRAHADEAMVMPVNAWQLICATTLSAQ